MGLNSKTFTGVILARGGSKRIKRKNIRIMAGKPLLYYTIKAAKDSKIFDQLYVSTEDEQIKKIAETYSVEVINRPYELASDTATSEDAMAHALLQVNKTDYVALLEPTHPLLTGAQLKAAASLMLKQNAEGVLSVVESSVPYINTISPSWTLRDWFPKELRKVRSQDIEPRYFVGGGIYIMKWSIFDTAHLTDSCDFFKHDIIAYPLTKIQGVDIDTAYDWRIAESLLKHNQPQYPLARFFIQNARRLLNFWGD